MNLPHKTLNHIETSQNSASGSDQVMGQPHAHDSAREHVQGSAIYIDDIREPAGTLHLAPGYANAACGRITKLELDKVRNVAGVIAVLTAKDIPGVNDCSPSIGDDPIFAEKNISFHGQVVFAVVATTRDIARRAAKLAHIEVDANPAIVSVDDGLAKGEQVLPPYEFKRGDPEAVVKNAEHKLEGSIRVGGQDHFYLEGQVALCVPQDKREMLVYSSTQHPTEIQHLVARMLGIQEANITCECRRMGGAFGGKESQAGQWACLAALASYVTGKPAKMRLDRDDDMIMTGKRHDFKIDYKAGFDDRGVLSAVNVDLNARCGYSADLSLGVVDRSMFHADNAYFYPDVRIASRRVKTNTVSNTAFRGFGGPQGMVFAERMLDSIAIKLQVDPLTIRKRNFYQRGRETTPYGMRVHDNIIAKLVQTLEKSSDYKQRRKAIQLFNKKSSILKKGIALNPVKFGIAFTLKHLNQAGALVHVYGDGSVHVNHGGTEMGQGLYIKVAQVVADELGVSIDKVHVSATRTDKIPNTTATAASAGSDLNGMAAKRAAAEIRARLTKLTARHFDANPKQLVFRNNRVDLGGHAHGKTLNFSELTKLAFLERVSLSATGYYATPKITWNRETASGRPFLYFAYGAACSEVTIDTLTGESKVDRVDILHDVGKSLNPAIDIGQIEGGFVQGMGWLTTEELVFSDDGRLLTHAPSTYKIPTASDVPEDFRVSLWESKGNKEATIFRSKAVGEPPLMLATSVFSAIYHALASINQGHIPELDAPATPERIARAAAMMKMKR